LAHYGDRTKAGRLLAEIRTSLENMKEMMNEMKDKIIEDMNANRKADQENLKEMRDHKSGEVEMRSIVGAIEEKMDA
jgi:hypothetical protein